MKFGIPAIIAGVLIIIFGTLFHFQGQGFVGPESSFMYSNPDWVWHGLQIIVVGIAISCLGIAFLVKKTNR